MQLQQAAAIKLKTSPARLALLLQPSLAFCCKLQPMTAYRTVRCHWLQLKPNTHSRRRRNETVLSRRVGVGSVYMNSRRLPTDSATHNTAVGGQFTILQPRLPTGVFTPSTRRNCRQLVANSCTHRRRDATRQFRLVGVGGVYWA